MHRFCKLCSVLVIFACVGYTTKLQTLGQMAFIIITAAALPTCLNFLIGLQLPMPDHMLPLEEEIIAGVLVLVRCVLILTQIIMMLSLQINRRLGLGLGFRAPSPNPKRLQICCDEKMRTAIFNCAWSIILDITLYNDEIRRYNLFGIVC